MGRLWKELNENILTEDDLISLAKCHNVSVYRKENFKNYKSITYRCSQYRIFTECQYQLKAKVFNDGNYRIFYSQHHEHGALQDSIVPKEIRSVVRDLTLEGLTVGQIQKTMKVLHPDISIGTKLKNVVDYEKKKIRSSIKFMDDLKEWCSTRASYSPPDEIHKPFIPYFNVVDINTIFMCITTRQLLSTCKWSSTLAIDCTYKITSCELPLLIFGTSDINRRFFPMGLCLISTDEAAETFVTLLNGIQAWAAAVNNQPYKINAIMADGAPGLTAAVTSELSGCRRLMCWAHVIRNIRKHRTLIKSKETFLMVEKDITDLQLAINDQVFFTGAKLMLEKWAADKDLHKFSQYFSQQWLSHLCYWYEAAAPFNPSTNNGLESLNGRIKQHYTMRNKLALAPFLQLAEKMLVDWSTNNIQQPFQIHLTIDTDLDLKAYDWINKVDRNEILQLDAFTFVVPAKEPKMNTRSWINYFCTMSWSSYDHFKQWLGSARILNYSNMLPPIFCSCKFGLKQYSCIHTTGLMMIWGVRTIPQLIGKRNAKGRRKKARHALSHD